MNNEKLIIYDFPVLFDILNEIKSELNFELLNVSKKEYSHLQLKDLKNYSVVSKKKLFNIKNQIVIDNLPLKISKIIETININILKKRFIEQSDIDLGLYKINLNSRKMFNEKHVLNLTEKEADIIIYLKNSGKSVTINQLQTNVWGHSSKLETHTVETHIYRLRKKISDIFQNNDFIKSTKSGYKIK